MSASSMVPSAREIELADYKLGQFRSDLDLIEQAVERLVEPMTPAEYLALDEAERETRIAELPTATIETVTRLLVFAVDLEGDARDLLRRAGKLRDSALLLAHQGYDDLRRDEWDDYRTMLAAWHAEAAEHYGAERGTS